MLVPVVGAVGTFAIIAQSAKRLNITNVVATTTLKRSNMVRNKRPVASTAQANVTVIGAKLVEFGARKATLRSESTDPSSVLRAFALSSESHLFRMEPFFELINAPAHESETGGTI